MLWYSIGPPAVADEAADIEDIATSAAGLPSTSPQGHDLELEWLRDLDADAARRVLMNFPGTLVKHCIANAEGVISCVA